MIGKILGKIFFTILEARKKMENERKKIGKILLTS
jgi:hypothetical protein